MGLSLVRAACCISTQQSNASNQITGIANAGGPWRQTEEPVSWKALRLQVYWAVHQEKMSTKEVPEQSSEDSDSTHEDCTAYGASLTASSNETHCTNSAYSFLSPDTTNVLFFQTMSGLFSDKKAHMNPTLNQRAYFL